MFRMPFCCVLWPLALSLPLLVVFTVYLLIFFVFFRSLLHICRLRILFAVPECFVFRLARSSSFTCLSDMALFLSARNVGWEAKEISLHFIPQRVLSRAKKARRSFNLGWEAGMVFYIVFPRVWVGLRSRVGLLSYAGKPRRSVTMGWEAEKIF